MRVFYIIIFFGFLYMPAILKAQYFFYRQSELGFELILAAENGDSSEVNRLIDSGAEINSVTDDGVSALMYAAQNGHDEIVNILMDRGADPDLRSFNGFSALVAAIRQGNLSTAELLIRKGADVNLPDFNDVTPLMYACAYDYYMSDMLIYYGADIEKQDNKGYNALIAACINNNYELAVLLIKAGIQINIRDNKLWTALHHSAYLGYDNIAELLILAGAEIDGITVSGFTPFALAVEQDNYNAALLLASFGADVNVNIIKPVNPLFLARRNKNSSMISMLLNQGAKPNKRPYFNRFTTGFEMGFNQDLSIAGFFAGLNDTKYKLWPALGFNFSMKTYYELIEESSLLFYQYQTRNSHLWLSLDKGFALPLNETDFQIGVFTGVKPALSWGRYMGTEKKPSVKMVLIPRTGIFLEYKYIRTKLYYSRIMLYPSSAKGFFNFSVEFMPNRKKDMVKYEIPYWL